MTMFQDHVRIDDNIIFTNFKKLIQTEPMHKRQHTHSYATKQTAKLNYYN